MNNQNLPSPGPIRIPELRHDMPRIAKKIQAKLRLKKFCDGELRRAVENCYKKSLIGEQKQDNRTMAEYGAFVGHCIVSLKKGLQFGKYGKIYFLSYDNPNLAAELNDYMYEIAEDDVFFKHAGLLLGTYLAFREYVVDQSLDMEDLLRRWLNINGEWMKTVDNSTDITRFYRSTNTHDLSKWTLIKDEMPRLAARQLNILRLNNYDFNCLSIALKRYLTTSINSSPQKEMFSMMHYGAFVGHTMVTIFNGMQCGDNGKLYDISYDNPNLEEDLDSFLHHLANSDDRYDFLGTLFSFYVGTRHLRISANGYEACDRITKGWAPQILKLMSGDYEIPVF